MRTVIGYIEGRAIWSENVPAYGATFAIRGELAKPAPRPAKGAGLTANQVRLTDPRPTGRPRTATYRSEAEAEARRASWRESKRRRRAVA